MKIAIGSDHAGFALKVQLRDELKARGLEVTDFGTNTPDSTDYPDYAAAVGHAVASGKVDMGVLVCFTGVGMSIAANKIDGVRAGLGTNAEEVHFIRAHNDANVLTLGAHFTPHETATKLVEVFLETPFEGGRHARRVDKITALENQSGS